MFQNKITKARIQDIIVVIFVNLLEDFWGKFHLCMYGEMNQFDEQILQLGGK